MAHNYPAAGNMIDLEQQEYTQVVESIKFLKSLFDLRFLFSTNIF